MPRLHMACASHVGLVRENNEDAVLIHPEQKLVVLADGMGGHNAGDIASFLSVEAASRSVAQGESLYSAVIDAHNAVQEAARSTLGYGGMGTTLLIGRYAGRGFEMAYVGDSRLYRLRKGELEQISRDHTLAQELRDLQLDELLEESTHYEHVLTSAVGVDTICKPVVVNQRLNVGDVHMYCSDGLYCCADEDEIAALVRQAAEPDDRLEDRVQALVALALDNGAPDNVSVALVRYR